MTNREYARGFERRAWINVALEDSIKALDLRWCWIVSLQKKNLGYFKRCAFALSRSRMITESVSLASEPREHLLPRAATAWIWVSHRCVSAYHLVWRGCGDFTFYFEWFWLSKKYFNDSGYIAEGCSGINYVLERIKKKKVQELKYVKCTKLTYINNVVLRPSLGVDGVVLVVAATASSLFFSAEKQRATWNWTSTSGKF